MLLLFAELRNCFPTSSFFRSCSTGSTSRLLRFSMCLSNYAAIVGIRRWRWWSLQGIDSALLSPDLPSPSEVEFSLQNGPLVGNDICPHFPARSSHMVTFQRLERWTVSELAPTSACTASRRSGSVSLPSLLTRQRNLMHRRSRSDGVCLPPLPTRLRRRRTAPTRRSMRRRRRSALTCRRSRRRRRRSALTRQRRSMKQRRPVWQLDVLLAP